MTATGLGVLGGLTAEQFLQEYWQRKPLLIRQALPQYTCPFDAQELAGLALEEGVEARIIQEAHADGPWHLSQGPFAEDDFLNLPATHWTLLVQQLDAWVPEINALKQHFSFLPHWRIDDIMASFAPEGGSVGPHFDYYDVFLLQAEGQREWRIGQVCDDQSTRLDGTPLNILAEFNEQQRYVLTPGDMLYLPPHLAHHGIARGDCITLSIGFRAPSHQQILEGFLDHMSEQIPGSRFFTDAGRSAPEEPGCIDAASIAAIRDILRGYLNDEAALAHWLGTFATEPKNPAILVSDDDIASPDALCDFAACGQIVGNEGSRFAYVYTATGISLFIDGEAIDLYEYDLFWVRELCEHNGFALNAVTGLDSRADLRHYLHNCLRQGSLLLEDSED